MVVDVDDTDAHDFQSTLVAPAQRTRSNLSKVSSCLIWGYAEGSMAMAAFVDAC